jgi:hypothetical protein
MAKGGGGVNVAQAVGTVTINADVDAAQGKINSFSVSVTQQLQAASAATSGASQSFNNLGNSFSLLQKVFATGLIISGLKQFGEAAIASEQLSTSYARQKLAAESMAGSQEKLNDLMGTYDRATGGILSKQAELQNVTKLLSVGFADNTAEIEKFATAIRGISIATGKSEDFVTQNLILELFSQRGQRLDQLGLEYSKVSARSEQLQQADGNLTKAMAYQQAVLEQAQQKFGALTTSAEGQATAVETLVRKWDNLRLAIADTTKGPIDAFAQSASRALDDIITRAQQAAAVWKDLQMIIGNSGVGQSAVGKAGGNILGGLAMGGDPAWVKDWPDFGGIFMTWLDKQAGNFNRFDDRPSLSPDNTGGGRFATVFPRNDGPSPITDLNKLQIDWATKTHEIEQNARDQRLAATTQFESQRLSIERSFAVSVSREAQDFATQRARENRDAAQQLAQIHEDTARAEVNQAAQLARQVADARADSADRLAQLQEDHERTVAQKRQDSSERLADLQANRDEDAANARADSAKRIGQIERDYNDQREKQERDHRNRLQDAALNNDAKAVFLEQRRNQDQTSDQLRARDKQIGEESQKLDKSLDQINKNYQKRADAEEKSLQKALDQENAAYGRQVEQEKKALDKRINQAQEAYNRQMTDLTAADNKRTEDLQAALLQRQQDEDADRTLRNNRAVEDHAAQLTELNLAQQARLTQIDNQQKEQRDKLNDKFLEQLADQGTYAEALKSHFNSMRDNAVQAFNDWWQKVTGTLAQGVGKPVPPADNTAADRSAKEARRAEIEGKLLGMGPSNPDYGKLLKEENEIDTWLREHPIGKAAAVAASMLATSGALWAMPMAGGAYPTAAASAAGVGSMAGGHTTITGDISINVHGAVGQSEEKLASLVRQELLNAVKRARGAG